MISKNFIYRIKTQQNIWILLISCASALAMLITSLGTLILFGALFLLFIFALSHKYRISLSLVFFHLGTLIISLTTFRAGGVLFNTSDLFYLISALMLFGSLLGTKGDFCKVFIKDNPLLAPLLIFLFGAVLSMINSADPRNAAIALGKYAFIFGVWLPLGISLLDSVAKVRWMLIILVVASLLPITTCLSDYFLHTEITAYLDHLFNLNLGVPYPTINGRFGAVMGHPNNFAMFLTVVFPIALFCFFITKNMFLRLFGFIYLFSIFAGIFISGSRACLVAILVALMFFSYLMLREKRLLLFSIVIMAILIAYIAVSFVSQEMSGLFPENPAARMKAMLSMDLGSYSPDIGRIESLRKALGYIREHPIAGIGAEYVAPTTNEQDSKLYVLNTLVRLWASIGMFGLVSCVLFYIKPIQAGFRKIYDVSFTDFERRNLIAILLCSFIGSIVFDMVQPQFHNRVKWIVVICLFSLCNIENHTGVMTGRYQANKSKIGSTSKGKLLKK